MRKFTIYQILFIRAMIFLNHFYRAVATAFVRIPRRPSLAPPEAKQGPQASTTSGRASSAGYRRVLRFLAPAKR